MPRTIIGYHGCSQETAERILVEQRFLPSTKAYDWLGEGVYFWEYAPYRALDWATEKCSREGGEPAVIRATIKLGRCLNLLDIEHVPGCCEEVIMKLKKRDPNSPEVIDEAIEMLRRMTPEELLAFLTYRTPGIEETDMTGMFSNGQVPKHPARAKRRMTPK